MGLDKRFFCVAGVFLSTQGCVTSHVTSFVAPEASPAHLQQTMIFADGVGLEGQQIVENTLHEELQQHGVRAIKSIDVYPPTRDFPKNMWETICEKENLSSLLVFTRVGINLDESYVPAIHIPGSTSTFTHTGIGGYSYTTTQANPSHTFGGYSVYDYAARYDVSLKSCPRLDKVWVAEVNSTSEWSDFQKLNISAAKKLVKQLIKDRLIEQTQ